MKVYTNKYPILDGFYEIEDCRPKKETIEPLIPEGKVFKVIAVVREEILLESEGKTFSFPLACFDAAFTDTDI